MASVVLLSLLSVVVAQAVAPAVTGDVRSDIPAQPLHTVDGYQIP